MPHNNRRSQRRLLTYGEAAEYLDLSVRKLQRAVAGGQLDHYKPGGRDVRFSRDQLDDYLASCLVSGGREQ